MGSRAFLYCALLLAFVLLISSEMAANAAEEATNPNVGDAKHGGGGYQGDPGHDGYSGNLGPGENTGYEPTPPYRGGGGGGGGGGSVCIYGCCGPPSYTGMCESCCNHANEAVDAQPQN